MQLATARQQYGPDHPDVTRLEREVASLTQAIQSATAGHPGVPTGTGTPDNPSYIQVKAQREATDAQRDSLTRKRSELKAKIVEMEQRLAASPAVERDYANMLRELDSDQLKYREVQQKQMEAQLSENLEDEQKGERFSLIGPPLAPESPYSPNRWLISGVGLLLAFAVGIVLVLVLESRDQSVRNRSDLEYLVAVSPLAVIPRMFTMADYARRRRHRILAVVGAVMAVGVALALTHFFYRPLDVLFDVILRKLGV
jgi:uncharacterized protein involved in exopolysaccharide biosynthesis